MDDVTPSFRYSLENSFLQGYRISALIVGLYFLILLPWRMGWMRQGSSHKMLIWETLGLVVLCMAMALLADRMPKLLGHVENWGLLLLGMGLLNNVSVLVLSRDPDQAANFMVIMVFVGFGFLSRWRFVFSQVISFLLWAVGTALMVGWRPFHNWLFPMIAALMLGLVLHLFAGRLLKTLEVLQTRDQILLRHRERLIAELREAMEKMKTLRGLIPICAQCKKVRNDEGYWQQVEAYLADHSEAQVTHGLCPGCAYSLKEEFEQLLPPEEAQV